MEESQNFGQETSPQYNYKPMRNNNFMLFSLLFGILAILSCSLIIPPLIFGGLGILFALLSKGNDQKVSGLSKGGIATSIVGITLGLVITVSSIYFIFTKPAYRQMLNNQCQQMYGVTFDELLEGKMPEKSPFAGVPNNL